MICGSVVWGSFLLPLKFFNTSGWYCVWLALPTSQY